MRSPILFVAPLFILACGTTSSGAGGAGPSAGGSPPPASDAGSAGGAVDAGTGGGSDAGTGGGGAVDAGGGGGGTGGGGAVDAGTGGGTGSGGGTADAGSGNADGGTAASDCDGLMPAAPGAPSQFKLVQDLNEGACFPGETDGTGHIAVSWQNSFQPHDSDYTFIDPATSAAVGSFRGTRLVLIGQASGFMGGECQGADCFQDYVVVGPTGNRVNGSPVSGTSNGKQANDPTGGMIHVRLSSQSDPVTVLLDAIDASGNVRWTRALPEPFRGVEAGHVVLGVDRQGNVLALWMTSLGRFGNAAWAGQWFDHGGNAGPEFQAVSGDAFPASLWERVGNGLFLLGFPGERRAWVGQFEPLATSLSAAPSWLAATPDVTLHMVHGGTGYARLPLSDVRGPCEQDIEVVSPSGQSCGTARFVVDGGSCLTDNITVGYDGTVIQQLPREREAACTAAGHQCDCTYRFWPGYFR
jgi:hypothetical protein